MAGAKCVWRGQFHASPFFNLLTNDSTLGLLHLCQGLLEHCTIIPLKKLKESGSYGESVPKLIVLGRMGHKDEGYKRLGPDQPSSELTAIQRYVDRHGVLTPLPVDVRKVPRAYTRQSPPRSGELLCHVLNTYLTDVLLVSRSAMVHVHPLFTSIRAYDG
jgi:hypothetical protein